MFALPGSNLCVLQLGPPLDVIMALQNSATSLETEKYPQSRKENLKYIDCETRKETIGTIIFHHISQVRKQNLKYYVIYI